ncbi:beta-1,3-galactosyltransferase 2-like [Rhinatrema bivittatum]|uniref:beta-1,3-galactosyltransferase 2-like n=1 Tax=Rhinatrema bivittatum TaxID=194408 RepID=UPI001129D008|nr:beta-1,3-galactosyltransferase 2-like [Rhinatrema bivittatum]
MFLHSMHTRARSKAWQQVELMDQTQNISPLSPPLQARHPLQVVYPYSYQFLLNEPDKCKETSPFLLLIIARVKNVVARNAIRETWGNESAIPGVSIARLFLVGMAPSFRGLLQNFLQEESRMFGDIIQQDFLDTYHNLTLKTLMGMEWVSRYCPNARYVMKVDSDMFFNADYLVHSLLKPEELPRERYISGLIVANTGPLRSKAYKWYVPKEIYPNDTYPPYCAGPGYVFSADMAKRIYDVAQGLKVVNMEDVFMGICLYELQIQITKPPAGLFNGHHIAYDRCKFKKLIIVHHYSAEQLLQLWPDFQNNTACS